MYWLFDFYFFSAILTLSIEHWRTQAWERTTSNQKVIFPSAMIPARGRRTWNKQFDCLISAKWELHWLIRLCVWVGVCALLKCLGVHCPRCSWSTDHFNVVQAWLPSLWRNKKTKTKNKPWIVSKPTGTLQWRDKYKCRRHFEMNDSWSLNIWYCWECKVVKISGNAHCMQPSRWEEAVPTCGGV